MSSGHTPEPWTAELVDVDGYYKKWRVSPHIADVFYETPAGEANAKLIAAAPELLAALKFAANVMRHHEIDTWLAGEFEIVTDAIAKAEGGE